MKKFRNRLLLLITNLCVLLSVLPCAISNAQEFTPYPEGYLNELTKVDMSKAPPVFVTKGGQEIVTQIKDERRWNYAWYWDQVRKKAPQMFDAENNLAIDKGYAPRVNDQFLKYNPQFKKFIGQKLHHHHYNHGKIAYALPEMLHTGKGFTKLWHRFGKRTLFLLGTALTIYELGVNENPFIDSPFELWVNYEVEELELSNLELAMKQGYSNIKRYIENCKSCSELSIFFADAGEVAYYLHTGNLPENYVDGIFEEQLPENGNRAASILNKAVEFGIIFRKDGGIRSPIGIIDLPRYAE